MSAWYQFLTGQLSNQTLAEEHDKYTITQYIRRRGIVSAWYVRTYSRFMARIFLLYFQSLLLPILILYTHISIILYIPHLGNAL